MQATSACNSTFLRLCLIFVVASVIYLNSIIMETNQAEQEGMQTD